MILESVGSDYCKKNRVLEFFTKNFCEGASAPVDAQPDSLIYKLSC